MTTLISGVLVALAWWLGVRYERRRGAAAFAKRAKQAVAVADDRYTEISDAAYAAGAEDARRRNG